MKSKDWSKRLPPELTFPQTSTYLYRIGLSLRLPSVPNRRLFHSPLLIFIVLVFVVSKEHYFIHYLEDNKSLSIKLGNIAYFLKMNFHYNMGSNLFFYLAIYSQIVYYFNNRRGIKPTFLRVFDMISGTVTPSSIGLSDKTKILSLIRRTRLLFRMCAKMSDISVFIFGNILVYTPYLLFCSPKDILIYGVPNNLLYVATVYYSSQINLFQVIYLYLICYYIKIKIHAIHERINLIIKSEDYTNIGSVLKSLNEVFVEVNEYNQTFWSKFMIGFWLTIGAQIVLFLFGAIFMDMSVLHRLIMAYILVILMPMFLFVIFTAASVNFEANKSFKALNRLNISFIKESKLNKRLKLSTMFKLRSFIERTGLKDVGFSCWKLFTINHFRCYEVLSSLCVFFLKTYEMSINSKGIVG